MCVTDEKTLGYGYPLNMASQALLSGQTVELAEKSCLKF